MSTSPSSSLRMIILILALATGLIHLVLGFGDLSSSFGIIFILNGLGYLGLAAAGYLDIAALSSLRQLARLALIGFTLLTIVLYFVINPDPFGSVFGLITKVIELALVVALVVDRRSA